MKTLRSNWLAAVLMVAAMAAMTFAQGPMHKRVNYTINVNYALRMGDYILPPGNYVLYQVSQNDLNLFGLFPQDLTHSPIAMIRTTRIEYQAGDYPEETRLILDSDETRAESYPVLRGWNIPGMDGWEIISVVAKDHDLLTRVR